MKFALGMTATLLVVAHIWAIHTGLSFEAFEDITYVRGYLGYLVATLPPFLAGALTLYAVK